MKPEDLLKTLEGDGWMALEQIEAAELTELTMALGKTSTSKLSTRDTDKARRPSLSSMHGRGVFPPHTDGAAMALPPRFVAIWSEQRYRAATLLYDGEDEALHWAPFSRSWLVRGRTRPFYAVPRRQVARRTVWRLNPDIMHPADRSLDMKAAMEPFSSIANARIEWAPGLAVIWDNRRMLHAREAVEIHDGCRELMRISIA